VIDNKPKLERTAAFVVIQIVGFGIEILKLFSGAQASATCWTGHTARTDGSHSEGLLYYHVLRFEEARIKNRVPEHQRFPSKRNSG
jgi:hypothetical protein